MTAFLIEDQPEAAPKVHKRAIRCGREPFALEINDAPFDNRVPTTAKGEVQNDIVLHCMPARALARSLIELQSVGAGSFVVHI